MKIKSYNRIQYVVGFMFRAEWVEGKCKHDQVLLIKKNKPDWQKGRLNGIGGKINLGEEPVAAMIREFYEESGLQTVVWDWRRVAMTQYPLAQVYFFTGSMHHRDFDKWRSMTDEEIIPYELLLGPDELMLPTAALFIAESSYWLPDDPCRDWPNRSEVTAK